MKKTIDEILTSAEEIDVGEDWFKVLRLPNSIFCIQEPHHWQKVISFLIIGSSKAVLFDTGMGIKDISKVVERITDLEVIVVNSHAHFDHVGDNHRFDTIFIFDDQYAIQQLLTGHPNRTLQFDTVPKAFSNGYPEGFNPLTYEIRPVSEDKIHLLHDGEIIDLGNRKLEVLHTPGHSSAGIMLLDRECGALFTGDTFYPSLLFAFLDEEQGGSNIQIYQETMRRVAALVPYLDLLYCSHAKALVDPRILHQVVEAFEAVNQQEVDYRVSEIYGEKVRIYNFDGFSIAAKLDL